MTRREQHMTAVKQIVQPFLGMGWLTDELRQLSVGIQRDVCAVEQARIDGSLAGMAAATIELKVKLTQATTLTEALRETLRKHIAGETK